MHRVEVNSVHPGYRYIGDKSPHKCGYNFSMMILLGTSNMK